MDSYLRKIFLQFLDEELDPAIWYTFRNIEPRQRILEKAFEPLFKQIRRTR